MTNKQEKIIRQMQEVSFDGVLPSSKIHRTLYQRVRLNFDSWEKAAVIAGLKTIKQNELEKLQSKNSNSKFYLDRFLIALKLAERKQLKGGNIVEGCMEAARKGVLDDYKIIGSVK